MALSSFHVLGLKVRWFKSWISYTWLSLWLSSLLSWYIYGGHYFGCVFLDDIVATGSDFVGTCVKTVFIIYTKALAPLRW